MGLSAPWGRLAWRDGDVCRTLTMRPTALSLPSPWPASLVALAALGGCGPGPAEQGEATQQQPNVLLVVIDTLRADRLGIYGYDGGTSPLLDEYARDCFVFEDAQTVAPWTVPALISLMTSLRPDAHAVEVHRKLPRLPDRVDTLAEILSRGGYATAAFTEGGYAKGSFGLDQGFDHFPTHRGDARSYTSNQIHPSRLALNMDRLLGWLEERPAEEPFFAFFQTYEVHAPFRAPVEVLRRFAPDYDEESEHAACADALRRWNEGQRPSAAELRLLQRHLLHCGWGGMPEPERTAELVAWAGDQGVVLDRRAMALDPELLAWLDRIYDAEIAYTDQVLQRLWDALEERGRAEDTIVVIVSDHGEGLGQHGDLGHGRLLHDELLRIALLVKVPGDELTPRRITRRVRLIDVAPTVLELLDLSAGGTPLSGESLVPLLRGEVDEPPASIGHVEAWGAYAHSVRAGDWKLLVDHTRNTTSLFDVAADPGELVDLAQGHPEVVARLEAVLDERREQDQQLREQFGAGEDAAVIDDATQQDLEGLGYTGSDDE